ncbi:protein Jumonji isoform X2 [Maniola jurtina]|uniref:protein Jumonji isoform X2 n=1 Tax=Maniola jurtina TaxID=191418 RepID=UPI001E68984F|nr:protein Jumonji isoform X2 [Maniola jurtina]
MKPKVQAQRKFAQGAFVPPAVAVTERRTVEPPEQQIIVTNNTSAKRVLDSVTFSHPGMHLHMPRVVLERCSLNTTTMIPATTTNKRNYKRKKINEKSTRVLRSTRSRQESSEIYNSEDDRPLRDYYLRKKRSKPEMNGNETTRKKKKLPQKDTIAAKKRKSTMLSTSTEPIAGPTTTATTSLEQPQALTFEYLIVKEEPLLNLSLNDENDALPEDDSIDRLSEASASDENLLGVDDALPGNDDPPICDNSIKNEPNQEEPNPEVVSYKLEVPPTRHEEGYPEVISSDEEVPPTPHEGTTGARSHEPERTELPSSSTQEPSISEGCSTAPTFYPTEDEFRDPLAYYLKIAPIAAQYGLCKVVPPPSFKPECKTTGLDRVTAGAQYPARFFKRWGDGTLQMCAIRTYLASHNVFFPRPPLVDGLEVNLPKMFRVVQGLGGFKEVSIKKKWSKVAERMNFIKLANPEKKLDHLYVKYILPYDILTNDERRSLYHKVEARWHAKQQLLQRRADNPLHLRKIYLNESEESSDEGELSEEESNVREAILDVEDCVKAGRQMPLATFRKVSRTALNMHFPNGEPTVDEIERAYWQMVHQATDHIGVYTASVDTSQFEIGFTTNPSDPISRHPWNLKNICQNEANILRFLGAVVSTTVPILHFGMIYSTNCWHRDPHGLPWLEYLHEGREKIWYGIPDQHSDQFRRAVEQLCPTSVQNKSMWLPSDITMIPPDLLLQEGVSLTKIIQKPGEFIFVLPKAYSCSICTDFTMAESVYFAVQPWQMTLHQVFQELRDCGEPMMFAPEQLLLAITRDERVSPTLYQEIVPQLVNLLEDELKSRFALIDRGIPAIFVGRKDGDRPYNVNEEAECGVCRRPLYLSQVKVKNYKSLNHACPQDAHLILEKLDGSENSGPIDMVLETLVSDSVLRRILSGGQKKRVDS